MSASVLETSVPRSAISSARVSLRTLITSVLCLFTFDNLLLLHFWGLPLPATLVLALTVCLAFYWMCSDVGDAGPTVSLLTLGLSLVLAISILLIGGEGRIFYANADWQIRDAVLQDLAKSAWPFYYQLPGGPVFLRAPLGMYMFPSMWGVHADAMLLIWNGLHLGLLIALASALFTCTRTRLITLTVFLVFSGWDIVGTALYTILGAHLSWDHIEQWNLGHQYSANLTLAFWVPQHAIAGWTCSVLFLLWRKGLIPVGVVGSAVPLVAFWSPLAIMGAVPFVIWAGLRTLAQGALRQRDAMLVASSVAIATPALLYLQTDAAQVGFRFHPVDLMVWVLCVSFEVLPFAWPLLRSEAVQRTDKSIIWIVLLLLCIMPFIQVGSSMDFQMRASIMPLALLSVLFGQWLGDVVTGRSTTHLTFAYGIVALVVGSATPMLEVRRAIINNPSPKPLCSLIGAWRDQTNKGVPFATYLAPVRSLPPFLRNVSARAYQRDPIHCWSRAWITSRHS